MKDANDNQTKDMLADIVKAISGNNFSSKGQSMQTTQAIQYLEEIKDAPIDTDSILTDDQLSGDCLALPTPAERKRTLRAALVAHDKCPPGGDSYIPCTCQQCTTNRAELHSLIAKKRPS